MNSSLREQNGRYFADDIFQMNFRDWMFFHNVKEDCT